MNENALELVTSRVTGTRSKPCDGNDSALRSSRIVLPPQPVSRLFHTPT